MKKPKSVQLLAWVTVTDRQSIQYLARKEGLTVSCYLRRLIRAERRKLQ